ncbi:MAG: sulfurtransferase TusA family protein [Gammaproteobacteria bacterium]|nr:sulfurtransferase TusA family protein [Gammaproteobacteria bacterium]
MARLARELDARNLICPMPVIRAQEHIKRLAPGDEFEVLATDPGALHDIPAWCRIHGHRIISTEENGTDIRMRIRVGDP